MGVRTQSDTDEDDLPLGSHASNLMARLAAPLSPSKRDSGKNTSSTLPNNASLDTSAAEALLKQQATLIIKQRTNEVDSCHAALASTLEQVKHVRLAEEARLAGRTAAVEAACAAQLEALKAEYEQQVDQLSSQTSEYLVQLRTESEACVAARVKSLMDNMSQSMSPQASPRHQPRNGRPVRATDGFDLPSFLSPQARKQAGFIGSPRTGGFQPSPTKSLGSPGGAASKRSMIGTAQSLANLRPVGLHRTEPGVLSLLAGDEDSD